MSAQGGAYSFSAECCSVILVLVGLLASKNGTYRLEEIVNQGARLAITMCFGGAALSHLDSELLRCL